MGVQHFANKYRREGAAAPTAAHAARRCRPSPCAWSRSPCTRRWGALRCATCARRWPWASSRRWRRRRGPARWAPHLQNDSCRRWKCAKEHVYVCITSRSPADSGLNNQSLQLAAGAGLQACQAVQLRSAAALRAGLRAGRSPRRLQRPSRSESLCTARHQLRRARRGTRPRRGMRSPGCSTFGGGAARRRQPDAGSCGVRLGGCGRTAAPLQRGGGESVTRRLRAAFRRGGLSGLPLVAAGAGTGAH